MAQDHNMDKIKPKTLKKLKPKFESKEDAYDFLDMPEDSEYAEKKQSRKDFANKLAEKGGEYGFPNLGAAAATVADLSADMMPGSRDEYVESLTPDIGGVKLVHSASGPIKAAVKLEGNALSKAEQAAARAERNKSVLEETKRVSTPSAEPRIKSNIDDIGSEGKVLSPEEQAAARAERNKSAINSLKKKPEPINTSTNTKKDLADDIRDLYNRRKEAATNPAEPGPAPTVFGVEVPPQPKGIGTDFDSQMAYIENKVKQDSDIVNKIADRHNIHPYDITGFLRNKRIFPTDAESWKAIDAMLGNIPENGITRGRPR